MSSRLVNEKTLELNITHEGMTLARVGVFGFTQEQESIIGADVLFPCGKPFIIQFKATKVGTDNHSAIFHINNNKKKNQHRALDAIAKSGCCDAYYAFPLIVTDAFLTSNFGKLLSFTCMEYAQKMTGNLNWIGQTHEVEVRNCCCYTVRSENRVKGDGFSAREFFEKKLKERRNKASEDIGMSDYVKDLITTMEHTVKEAGIVGQSEHTVTVIGTDSVKKRLEYLQLPIRIKGLQE